MKDVEISDRISARYGLPKHDVRKLVKVVFAEIAEQLRLGECVDIHGMMRLYVHLKPSRRYFSTYRQEFVETGPRRRLIAKARPGFKALIDQMPMGSE